LDDDLFFEGVFFRLEDFLLDFGEGFVGDVVEVGSK
jgi:hypothetical protein